MPSRPQRTPNPELLADERFLSLTIEARYLLLGLMLSWVDGYGRAQAHPSRIRSEMFEFDRIADDAIEVALLHLEERGWLVLYAAGRRMFMQVVDWERWVKVDQRGLPDLHPHPPDGPAALSAGSPRVAHGQPAVEGGAESGGEERQEARRQEVASAPLSDDLPPWYCTRHPFGIGATERACGPCGTSRKQHDAAARGDLSPEQIDDIMRERAATVARREESDE